MTNTHTSYPKSLLVKIMQWLYLGLGLACLTIPFIYQNTMAASFEFPTWFIWAIAGALIFYCLLLFLSFLTQNNNLLILSLVFIFITSIGVVILLGFAGANFNNLMGHGLPSCYNHLSECSLKNGIIVAGAASLVAGIPLLILNVLTIIGAVKAIAASD